jgi:deoxyribose-phosphate aldolase
MNLNQYIDATILSPSAKLEEYETLCCDAIKYQVAAICVPPTLVDFCHKHLADYNVTIASVVGFPNGYNMLNTKLNEIEDIIEAGAVEVDFVINRSLLADKNYDALHMEAKTIVDHCRMKNVLSKWIIEASILQEDELKKLCAIANDIKPDFVKTSTGVHGKARLEDVLFLRKNLYDSIYIKASGGISTREQALSFIEAGATRLGTSNYEAILT